MPVLTHVNAKPRQFLHAAVAPTCPLPQGNVCKHVLFVLLRVLHMSPDEPLVWQKALLASEVDEVGQQLLGTAAAPLIVRLVAALLVRPFVAHEFLDSQPHN